jgi:hypothetical protein
VLRRKPTDFSSLLIASDACPSTDFKYDFYPHQEWISALHVNALYLLKRQPDMPFAAFSTAMHAKYAANVKKHGVDALNMAFREVYDSYRSSFYGAAPSSNADHKSDGKSDHKS